MGAWGGSGGGKGVRVGWGGGWGIFLGILGNFLDNSGIFREFSGWSRELKSIFRIDKSKFYSRSEGK